MAKQYKLTIEKYQELRKEMDYLKGHREKEVAEQIKEARSFGDLSENSEYDEAKNEQGKLYARISELEAILSNYVIIENNLTGDTVVTGNRVKVEDVEEGFTEEYYIVGSQEADPVSNRISDESPFGKALLGKKVGEVAAVEAPMGLIHYKVIEIGA